MEILQVISKNKRNKRKMDSTGKPYGSLFQAKKGYAMCVVKEKGQILTRHMVKI